MRSVLVMVARRWVLPDSGKLVILKSFTESKVRAGLPGFFLNFLFLPWDSSRLSFGMKQISLETPPCLVFHYQQSGKTFRPRPFARLGPILMLGLLVFEEASTVVRMAFSTSVHSTSKLKARYGRLHWAPETTVCQGTFLKEMRDGRITTLARKEQILSLSLGKTRQRCTLRIRSLLRIALFLRLEICQS